MTPLDAVTATYFVARPDSQRMIVLRTAVNYNLRRDLATQLRVAGRALPGSAERVRELVAALRIDRRINSAVFTCHHQIATGLRRQDAGRVASTLGALSRLMETPPYDDLVLHTLMNVDPLITNGNAERFDAPSSTLRHLPRYICTQPDHPRPRPTCHVQGPENLWFHARIEPHDVTVARVLTGPDWTLVRTTAKNALLPRDARHRHEFSGVVSDPLC